MEKLYKSRLTLLFLPLLIAFFFAIISQSINLNNNKHLTRTATTSLSPLTEPIRSDITFKESAVSKGIIFKHEHRSSTISGLADTYGSGVCTIDFNNDGFEDLFIVNGNGVTRRYGKPHWWNNKQGSRLYKNVDGLYFSDLSNTLYSDKNQTPLTGYGCAVDDINNDGYSDIILSRVNYIELLINQAGVNFKKHTINLKLDESLESENIWPMSITLWDWNKDGYQDIFVANFTKYKNDLKVGTRDYGYKSQIQFDSKKFSGQKNLILTREISASKSNVLAFNKTYLNNFDRTLTITPFALLTGNPSERQFSNLFAANATGSNSYAHSLIKTTNKTTPFASLLSSIKTPIVQVSQINLLNKSSLVFTQHNQGGVQLYLSDKDEQDDLSWQVGLNSEEDNATQTWATLIADLNNDSLDDFIGARGFAASHIDSPFITQGSYNTIKLQTASGSFVEPKISSTPRLSRSSRGAAFADFNNDGFIDIVFNNNNGFFSLYMNEGQENNWLSFICEPVFLCRNSLWKIQDLQGNTLASKKFSQSQPFLSSNQKRVHFGLADMSNTLTLQVQLSNDTKVSFSKLTPNHIYKVNIENNKVIPINSKIAASYNANSLQPFSLNSLLNANVETLLGRLNSMPKLKPEQLIKLSELLITYELNNSASSVTNSPKFLTLTSWLLNQALTNTNKSSPLLDNVLRLIGGSESSLFMDHVVELVANLSEDNFCNLTNELNYWFWEEEVLPKTKQLLKSPLLHRILNSNSSNIVICGLNALATTKDTTIGSSLLSLLNKKSFPKDQQDIISAATIRTLGFLKHSVAQNDLVDFCKKSKDGIITAECNIALYKFGTDEDVIAGLLPLSNENKLIYELHQEKLILDLISPKKAKLLSNNMNTFGSYNKYLKSPQKAHYEIAHLHELLTAKEIITQKKSIQNLLSFRKSKDINDILIRLHQKSPSTIDELITVFEESTIIQSKLLPFASSLKIKQILLSNNEHSHDYNYSYTLAYQCSIRHSIKSICDKKLETNIYMTTSDVETTLINNPAKLIYALLSDNATLKRVTTLQLFDLSKQLPKANSMTTDNLSNLFAMLRINSSYLFIRKSQIKKDWLEQFISSAYQESIKLDLSWLQHFTGPIDQKNAA